MSVMSQFYSIIIDRGISSPGYDKEVVDVINAVDKRYIYQLMFTVKLPGSNRFDLQMQMHTGTQKNDVSLAKEFQQHLENKHRKNGVINQGKYKNVSWKYNRQTDSIMFMIMLTLNTNMGKFIVTQVLNSCFVFAVIRTGL